MAQTFGDQLMQFALAVDVIDESRFQDVRALVNDYTRNTLDITETRFMIESESDDRPALTPYRLASTGVYRSRPIELGDGKYGGQAAYAYAKEVRLWIVSADDGNEDLRDCVHYKDLWSKCSDLPEYRMSVDKPIRTSIIIPVRNIERRVFGVLNFETTERLDITKAAKDELQKIANALGIVYEVYLQSKIQRNRTVDALSKLKDALREPLPKLTKPKVFLASSSQAPGDVISSVMRVFAEDGFKQKFELVYWKDMHKPGDINEQLLKILGTCRYGICYLSEQIHSGEGNHVTESARNVYRDNANVVFEAGMLHGRSDTSSPVPASWIPIREQNSPTSPFDFASQRMIVVPRTTKGNLKKRTFEDLFRKRLETLAKKSA